MERLSRSKRSLTLALVGFVFLTHTGRADTLDTKKPHDVTTMVTELNDLQATLSVTQIATKELDKIGKDFSLIYRLRNLTLFFKSPDKMRMEGSSNVFGDGLLICNGPARFYTVPRMHIRKTDDLSASPGNRQSLLEMAGILSKDTLTFMTGEFVKTDTMKDRPIEVYDFKYPLHPKGTHYRIWIDPATHITVRREWYDSANNLKATFTYAEAREITPNVWLPSRCEVKNSEGVTAVVMTIKDVKVNQKLDDALFEITP